MCDTNEKNRFVIKFSHDRGASLCLVFEQVVLLTWLLLLLLMWQSWVTPESR